MDMALYETVRALGLRVELKISFQPIEVDDDDEESGARDLTFMRDPHPIAMANVPRR